MGKVFGILMIVLGVWIGIEIYTKGTEDACYGVFSWLDGESGSAATAAQTGQPRGSLVKRIGDKVRADIQTGAARSAGQTPEGDLDQGDTMNGDVDDVEE